MTVLRAAVGWALLRAAVWLFGAPPDEAPYPDTLNRPEET